MGQKTIWTTILCVTLVITAFVLSFSISKTQDSKFTAEFNTLVPEAMCQKNKESIMSIADTWWPLDAEDWAWLWQFCSKYNIEQLPHMPYGMGSAARYQKTYQLLNQLKAVDEYITSGDIPVEKASVLIKSAFIAHNVPADMDLIQLLSQLD